MPRRRRLTQGRTEAARARTRERLAEIHGPLDQGGKCGRAQLRPLQLEPDELRAVPDVLAITVTVPLAIGIAVAIDRFHPRADGETERDTVRRALAHAAAVPLRAH